MQKQKLPLLSISRENYEVPKGEERFVHYKAERVMVDSLGKRVSHPDLVKSNVKMFDNIKRNLELQGYTIEILYHPLGKYTSVRLPEDMGAKLAEAEKSLSEKDEELERLREELKRTKASLKEEMKKAKEESPIENKEESKDSTVKNDGEPKKAGRAKKETTKKEE